MDTLSYPVATEPEPPLTEAGQAALRDDVLSHLGAVPFEPGARIIRILRCRPDRGVAGPVVDVIL